MSSSPVTQTNQVVVADKATKTRQPTLPDKYGKFIQFAYYMMENVLGDEFQMDKAAFLEKIALFGSVGEQQVLVQGFLNGAKDNKKTIKKVISDRKKAEAKANKPARKSRAKVAAAAAEDGAVADAAVAPKRSRKTTKTVVQAANEQLLDDLVQIAAAQTQQPAVVQEPVIELVPEPMPEVVVAVVEEKKPKKKAAAKKTAAEPVAAADAPLNITNELVPETFIATEIETQVKEKAAPKRKSPPKKAAAAKTDTPILEDVVISGTDIEVSPITVDGVTYFMDEMSNLYAHPIPSASSIGKYNPLTRKIAHN
jgi:hypothetical protein